MHMLKCIASLLSVAIVKGKPSACQEKMKENVQK